MASNPFLMTLQSFVLIKEMTYFLQFVTEFSVGLREIQ